MSSICMHSGPNGSCPKPSVEGSLFCDVHSNELSRVQTYLIEDETARAHFDRQDQTNLHSVRAELKLLRMMINDRISMAKSEADRMAAYNAVGPWIATVDKLVQNLAKMERETSAVLTRETLLKVGQSIVQIIADELQHVEGREMVIDAIAKRIIPVVSEASN